MQETEVRTYRLFELCQSIKRLIDKTTGGKKFWVRCEIAKVNLRKGHRYLELADMDDNEVKARMQANLWSRDFSAMLSKHGPDIESLLETGKNVLLEVSIDYHEVYGLKLQVYDVNPNYTIGELEARKKENLEKLVKEGLLDKNSTLPLPGIIKKVGIISSPSAAGLEDFISHLENNPYGYKFTYKLFETSVQGNLAETPICRALGEMQAYDVDIAVLIRGGGSRLDLEVFNSYSIAHTIAHSSVPIFTGIGHETDDTLADWVSYKRLKTPTACANFIVDHNADFHARVNQVLGNIIKSSMNSLEKSRSHLALTQEGIQSAVISRLQNEKHFLLRSFDQLRYSSSEILNSENLILNRIRSGIRSGTIEKLTNAKSEVHRFKTNIGVGAKHVLRNSSQELSQSRQLLGIHSLGSLNTLKRKLEIAIKQVQLLDPKNVLKRGYAIVRLNNKVIKQAEELKKDDEIKTEFYTFETRSTIVEISKNGSKKGK